MKYLKKEIAFVIINYQSFQNPLPYEKSNGGGFLFVSTLVFQLKRTLSIVEINQIGLGLENFFLFVNLMFFVLYVVNAQYK